MRKPRVYRRNKLAGLTRGLLTLMLMVSAVGIAQAQDSEPAEEVQEAPVMDGLVGGQMPWEQTFDTAMLAGRQAYNSGDWEGAADAFVTAIQVLPEEAAPYRNLARTYHFMGDYRRATEYYDHYLRLAPEAGDVDQIQQERRGAASRAGDEPWRLPAEQRLALRALDRELDDGRALTAGGGAWRLFESLLSMDYATPEIARLRARLERKVGDEFDDKLAVDDGFLPVLNGDDWALQRDRIQALENLVRSEEARDELVHRRAVVDAGSALVAGDYEASLAASEAAMEGPLEYRFAGWYGAVALAQMERFEEAIERLDEVVDQQVFEGPGQQRAQVVRAQWMRQIGQTEEAAKLLGQQLR